MVSRNKKKDPEDFGPIATVTLTRTQIVRYCGRTLAAVEVEEDGILVWRKRERGGKYDRHFFRWPQVHAYIAGSGGRKSPAFALVTAKSTLLSAMGTVTRSDDGSITVVDDDNDETVFMASDDLSLVYEAGKPTGAVGDEDDDGEELVERPRARRQRVEIELEDEADADPVEDDFDEEAGDEEPEADESDEDDFEEDAEADESEEDDEGGEGEEPDDDDGEFDEIAPRVKKTTAKKTVPPTKRKREPEPTPARGRKTVKTTKAKPVPARTTKKVVPAKKAGAKVTTQARTRKRAAETWSR